MAMAVLRRHGSLMSVLSRFLSRPLPAEAERARMILLVAAAQILLLGTPAHAAVDVAVEQCRRDRAARHFDKLANAVLRRVAAEGPVILSGLDPSRLDVPAWLRERWVRTFGEDEARRIALASLGEPPLDLSASGDGEDWASRLAGTLLSTGSIRLSEHGRVEDLPGYGDGAWWVQDAAAALPARLVGAVVGLRIADLCAAPGGKTAQLATAGARVTAVDVSADRLETVRRNLARLKLADAVALVAADVTAWQPAEAPFDAVLLDAPCTATGTIRRHPDILHLKSEDEIARLAALQGRMLAAAARLVRPGGTLVYCVCSLEPEEGPERIAALLASPGGGGFERLPVRPDEIGAAPGWITPDGDLRTLPHHAPGPDVPGGMDGFYAARLVRRP
jgi:16S rRNA (cytosine967-C5)-methyltransferase